jgi:DNA (cytosine-5)-methyltransferase 1
MKKIYIFSFFSGSGLLDLGFELSGFQVVFVNEYHNSFLEAYKHSRRILKLNDPEYGHSSQSIIEFLGGKPISSLKNWVIEKQRDGIVGFIGGPPCPDFSVGGKNRGRDGKNGVLSEVYTNLVVECMPDFFLFENVKGLLRTLKHRTFFEELKKLVHTKNYLTTDRLINSIEYGAPQDRDRIILLGFNKSLVSDIDFAEKITNNMNPERFPWLKSVRYGKKNIMKLPWPNHDKFEHDSIRPMPSGIPKELTVQHWFNINQVESHPNSINAFKPRAGLSRFLSVAEGDDSKKSFKRLHRWRYSPTACYGNNEVHLHPYKPRRISVAESLAIQSLPSTFELPASMSLSDMFKTVGNGVPFLAAKGLADTINLFLGQQKCL